MCSGGDFLQVKTICYVYFTLTLTLSILITVFHRRTTHTCIIAHPQTLENLNFLPSIFNDRPTAHPQTFENPN